MSVLVNVKGAAAITSATARGAFDTIAAQKSGSSTARLRTRNLTTRHSTAWYTAQTTSPIPKRMVRFLPVTGAAKSGVSPSVTMYFVSEIGLELDSSLTLRKRTKLFKRSKRDSARVNTATSGLAAVSLSRLKGQCT